MISLESVDQSILELEKHDTSFQTCERLAWLYIVRDHLRQYDEPVAAALEIQGTSDLLTAIRGKDPEKVWPVIDDLMQAVQALHPKMYDKVIQQLQDL